MGNSESCGFGILNRTQHQLTICLTMGATHYWEENVMPGKIFYRWPGAVFYTAYVYPTTGITVNRRTANSIFEFDKSRSAGVVDIPAACSLTGAHALRGAGVVLDQNTEISLLQHYGISTSKTWDEFEVRFGELKQDVVKVFESSQSQLTGYKRGLYGGGRGSWLEVKGLPKVYKRNDGTVSIRKGDIDIQVKSYEEVIKRGEFTDYSYDQYHTRQ